MAKEKKVKKVKKAKVATSTLYATVVMPFMQLGNVTIDDESVTIDYKKPRSPKRITMTIPLNSVLAAVEGTEDSGYVVLQDAAYPTDMVNETISSCEVKDGFLRGVNAAGNKVVVNSSRMSVTATQDAE